jgi:hypothetical protein
MKLLIRQYVASLRERGELDAILPDLLSEMGYNIISRPSVGTRQYGVDIAAVGIDEDGERKLFLLSVKQGDLTREDWNGSPQALQPSLDEIRQIYLRLRVPREHQSLKVVICLCFGGEIHEAVQDNVTGYIEEHTNERMSFRQWNGDVIAGLLIKGILKQSLVAPELRSSFQKAVAMVDEPSVCFDHFSHLVRQLCASGKTSARLRLTTLRQLYLCLWVLYVWARDADNVEAPYLASEYVILHGWHLVRDDLGKSTKASIEIGRALSELIELNFTIIDEFAKVKVFPHVEKLHAISMATESPAPVDVNLKVFDLFGRLALRGLWQLWLLDGENTQPTVKKSWNDDEVQALTQHLVHLARNNPTLLSPMQDIQSVEVTLGLMLFTMQENWQLAASNWLKALVESFVFSYRTHGRYPTIYSDYRDLLAHPRETTDDYRKVHTASSTLLAVIGLWARRYSPDAFATLVTFVEEDMAYCDFQLWLPDEDSEARFYLGDDKHGAMLTGLPITTDLDSAFEFITAECSVDCEFHKLSAITMGHWPIILMACRHYRLPIPPNLWLELVRFRPELSS